MLREVFKYSNIKIKNLLATSITLSTFRYASPLLIDSTRVQLQSLQTLLIKATRPILGFQSYKWSTFKILDNLKWPNIYQLICSETIKYFHRIIFENSPPAITKLLYISHERSEVARS